MRAAAIGLTAALTAAVLCSAPVTSAQGRGGAAPEAGAAARAAAPIDLTGQWVAIISEDWRWRMITPAKGDYASIPLSVEGLRVANLWDPAKDEAAGEQCRAYGAPGVMRGPTRLRIAWLDDDTLKVETDYGTQTRLLQFRGAPAAVAPTWQGATSAQWVMAAGGGRAGGEGRGAAPRRFGSMKSVTTRLRPGYLRKNGVPYSAQTVFTEYWDVHGERNGDQYMVVTNTVEDRVNLQIPWITSLHFKKEPDGTKWDPTPCSGRF